MPYNRERTSPPRLNLIYPQNFAIIGTVSPVTKLLRSAPSQNYVFESAAVSQQRVKTAFLNDGKLLASQLQARGLMTPQLAQFIRIVQSGYLIEPRFESCMRAKGYKPESEVAEALTPRHVANIGGVMIKLRWARAVD